MHEKKTKKTHKTHIHYVFESGAKAIFISLTILMTVTKQKRKRNSHFFVGSMD